MAVDRKKRPTPGQLFYARTFALLTLGLLGFLAFRIVWPLLAPLVWAAILAFMLYPLYRRGWALTGERGNLAAGSLTIAACIFLVAPLGLVGVAFLDQATGLLRDAQAAGQNGLGNMTGILEHPFVVGALDWLEPLADIDAGDLRQWLTDSARGGLQFLASYGGEVFLGAVNTLTGFGIMLFALFFFLRDGQAMLAQFFGMIPLSPGRTETLAAHMASVMRAVVYGIGLTAVVQGALVGVGFAILGLPAPVVFGAMAALAALLPVGGPSIVWGPAAILLAIQGDWGSALFLTLWGLLLIATIDNFLRPLFVSHRAHVGTLTVFVGVLGGVFAFGAIGLVLGPVILALVIALLRFALELRTADPPDAAS